MNEPFILFKGYPYTKTKLISDLRHLITRCDEMEVHPDAEHPVEQAGATEMVCAPSQDVTPHA